MSHDLVALIRITVYAANAVTPKQFFLQRLFERRAP